MRPTSTPLSPQPRPVRPPQAARPLPTLEGVPLAGDFEVIAPRAGSTVPGNGALLVTARGPAGRARDIELRLTAGEHLILRREVAMDADGQVSIWLAVEPRDEPRAMRAVLSDPSGGASRSEVPFVLGGADAITLGSPVLPYLAISGERLHVAGRVRDGSRWLRVRLETPRGRLVAAERIPVHLDRTHAPERLVFWTTLALPPSLPRGLLWLIVSSDEPGATAHARLPLVADGSAARR